MAEEPAIFCYTGSDFSSKKATTTAAAKMIATTTTTIMSLLKPKQKPLIYTHLILLRITVLLTAYFTKGIFYRQKFVLHKQYDENMMQ